MDEVNYQYFEWTKLVRTVYKKMYEKKKVGNIPETLYLKMLYVVKEFSYPDWNITFTDAVNSDGKNYQPSALWKTIDRQTTKETKRKHCRITEAFPEMDLNEQAVLPIIMTLLICEGRIFQQQWEQQVILRKNHENLSEEETTFLINNGISTLYMLIFESGAEYRMQEKEEKIYISLWEEVMKTWNNVSKQYDGMQKILWEILLEVLNQIFGKNLTIMKRRVLSNMQRNYETEAENIMRHLECMGEN